jgi:excinuclease ABC subunit C
MNSEVIGMTQTEFQQIASSMPGAPGIYKYFDSYNTLLYVGKAKNLRKRISSYFTKTFTSYKTHELVKRINRIEFTIVNSEQDAFLLENSLIKQYQPIFNINLKDDKSYPFIVIKNEPFPRVFLTRQKIEDGSTYFGPYTSVKKVRELLNFIRQTIALRTCPLNLVDKNIEKGKFKVCLEFHLGNCKGPCEKYQSVENYNDNIEQVKHLLRGNLSPVIQHFKKEMKNCIEELEFEKADLIKKKIQYLENYKARSIVVSTTLHHIDVFSITKQGESAFVNFLMVQNGTIIQTKTIKVETQLDETIQEILCFVIAQLRTTFNSEAKEIIVPFELNYEEAGVVLTVPKGGDKKKLLQLSETNVQHFINEIQNKERLHLGVKNADKYNILLQMQKDLQLPEIPVHIECFDNSNFQGTTPVAAMVCFVNGEPRKKDYRHFNIKTVSGIDDFASMKEIVFRRYKRLVEVNDSLPQLVIIDGGKGQLNAARQAIEELDLQGKMTLIGLAKNEEEIFFVGDKESLKLPFDNESHRLIRMIRDEVHRFGINFHRLKRSKNTFKNDLQEITGIGTATANLLLKTYRSVNNVKQQTLEELSKIIGTSKARIVREHFDQSKRLIDKEN